MKKILLCLLGLVAVTGCKDESQESSAYLIGEEKVAYQIQKEVFTCKNEEFFYIEKQRNSNILNFIYGNYSTPLSQKPSTTTSLFSDGMYKLTIKGDFASVKMDGETVLEDCTKAI